MNAVSLYIYKYIIVCKACIWINLHIIIYHVFFVLFKKKKKIHILSNEWVQKEVCTLCMFTVFHNIFVLWVVLETVRGHIHRCTCSCSDIHYMFINICTLKEVSHKPRKLSILINKWNTKVTITFTHTNKVTHGFFLIFIFILEDNNEAYF